MSEIMMNTKEVAEYLGIHEKQVYALIKQKKIPCTRVTGKWLFQKNIIDQWIAKSSQESTDLENYSGKLSRDVLLTSGSNDPVLDVLFTYMKSFHPEYNIYTSSTGSTEGLQLLKERETDIAWCHLLDPQTGEYNIPQVSSSFENTKIAIVHLFYREIGFVISPQCKHKIKDFNDIADADVNFINRQAGSGTRILLDYNLEKNGIDKNSIKGYNNEVYTHMEVGLSILSGESEIGIASVAIARLLGLKFVPIIKESFDMVLLQSTFFEKWVQAFIEILNSDGFKDKVKPLGDYDFTEAGKILFSST